MGMSMGYVTVDHPVEESYATLERALELGVNHLDTSDFYGWGENEKLLCKLQLFLDTGITTFQDSEPPLQRK